MENNSDQDNNFNLLRFFFASLVIISHAPELQNGNRGNEILTQIFNTISFGEMAVDSFFILSGFLIIKSWHDRPGVTTFLSSRVLRVYPGFIASSLICAFIIAPIYGLYNYYQEFNYVNFFTGLVKLNPVATPIVFPDSPYPVINGAMWTIPYEFKCYLLALAFGFMGGLNKRWIALAFFILCTSAHIINRLGIYQIPFDTYIRCGMTFSAGAIFYLYKNKIHWKNTIALTAIFSLTGFLFIKPLAEPAVCILWGYAIIHYAFSGTTLLNFNKLPDISYGIYLYAWPINKILLWHQPNINVYLAMVLVFILSIASGIASWYVVEKPFIKLKKCFRNRPVQLPH